MEEQVIQETPVASSEQPVAETPNTVNIDVSALALIPLVLLELLPAWTLALLSEIWLLLLATLSPVAPSLLTFNKG